MRPEGLKQLNELVPDTDSREREKIAARKKRAASEDIPKFNGDPEHDASVWFDSNTHYWRKPVFLPGTTETSAYQLFGPASTAADSKIIVFLRFLLARVLSFYAPPYVLASSSENVRETDAISGLLWKGTYPPC